MASLALAPAASAHTDSLGFIINPGSTVGVFDVDIYYGSWHSPVPGPEGALDLSLEDGTLVGTVPFVLVSGFNGVSNGTIPAGLTPGVNYFFPDGNGGFESDVNNHGIYAFQYVTFLGLLPGSYTFGYNAGSSFTANWEPSDPMINAGAFIIGPDGQLVIIGAGPPTIDTSRSLFTSDEFSGGGDLTFDGGVLQVVNGADTLTNNIVVNATGGTIDTNLMDSTFGGGFSGVGVITIVGNGVVMLTGLNTHGGFHVSHAGISIDDPATLGADGAALTLDHGVLIATGSMTLDRDIVIAGTHGSEISVDDGLTVTMNGALSGSACLYKRGLGEFDLRANGANAIGACVEEGEMAFNATFNGDVWVDPGAFMSGAGQIVGDVEVGGTLSPGNSPGQLIVAGSVTQLAGSTLQVDIDGLTAGNGAGHYDTLVLTGAGSIYTADGTLAPILRGITAPANNTFTPDVGDTFTIVSAEGGIAGAFDTLTQPARGMAAGTRFDVLYSENTIVLAVTASDYGALADGLRNARAAASALQTVRPAAGATGTGNVGAYFAGLAGYDSDELALVFQQTAGDIHAASMQSAHRASRTGRDIVLERLNHRAQSRQMWGEVIGAYAEIDGDNTANGFDYRNGGLIVGADAPVNETWTIGGAFAFVESDVRGDGRAQTQSYQLIGYARWADGAYFANTAAAYSVDRYDIDRAVGLSSGVEALSASPDGETFAVDAEFGRRFQAYGAAIDLLAGLSWEQVSRDELSETGDGAVALTFGDEESEALRLRLGGRYSRELEAGGVALKPYTQAFAVHFTDGAATTLTPTLHGASFDARSANAGETGLQTGLGLTAELSSSLELYAHYRGDFTENQTEHAARIGARLAW